MPPGRASQVGLVRSRQNLEQRQVRGGLPPRKEILLPP